MIYNPTDDLLANNWHYEDMIAIGLSCLAYEISNDFYNQMYNFLYREGTL